MSDKTYDLIKNIALFAAPITTLIASLCAVWSVICRILSGIRCFCFGGDRMTTRVGVISIIVEDESSVGALNELLHSYGEYIVGRMGIPYRQRGVNIISVAIDAPQDIISALSGKIGAIKGISAKTALSNVMSND